MRKLLFLILSFIGFYANAQVESTISVPYTSSASPTFQALLYLPSDYNTTSGNYPLIIFCHGSGESCPPLSNIYNSSSAGGPPYEIEHGTWPTDGGFINPKDGLKYKFIVVSPQSACNSWSASGDQIENIKIYLVTHYRIDINRIYGTGLSSGGGGMIENVSHQNGNETGPVFTPTYPFAAVVPMSPATNSPQQSWMATMVHDSTSGWWFGDQSGDTYGEWALNEINFVNAIKTNYARLTGHPGTSGQNSFTTGHGPWRPFYIPTYTETFVAVGMTTPATMNMYQWFLTQTRPGAVVTTPTANAGSNQNITLPTNSATLSGSGTPGSGHLISSYGWTQISGPNTANINPSSSTTTGSTTVSGLIAGTYVFQLTVTNNISATATSTVSVTVNPAPAPTANAGPDRTLVLPTTTLTLDGSASSNTTSYSWTFISGPGTPTIVSPTSAITNINNLSAVGVYIFQLSVNGGVSTDRANVTVNAASTYPACGTGTKYTPVPDPSDSGVFIGVSSAANYKPGDTIVLSSAFKWSYFEMDGYQGNPSCPLVIINDVGITKLRKFIRLDGCTYIKIVGGGNSGNFYGLFIEYDPVNIWQGFAGIQLVGRTSNIEVTRVFTHHTDIGIVCENNGSCDPSQNYPNWIIDSIFIHDNKIVGTWNEGMYIGNTAPDNQGNDLRPVVCPIGVGGADSTIYPAPAKNGYTKIWNNIVDTTGRGGIQLANAINGPSEIYNNTVSHNGINGDDAQGAAINLGLYTQVYVHDNTISNTYTWGISSIGSGATNKPVRLENNHIDSSGFLRTFDLSQTSRDHYNPATEPSFIDSLPWPYPLFIDTRPRHYTTDSPHPGTAIVGQDSTQFWIKNNVVGLFKAVTRTDGGATAAIQIQDDFLGIQKFGNIICNNTNKNGSPATIFVDNSNGTINYSTNCSAPPTVNAGTDQFLSSGSTSVNLVGTAVPTSGATITQVTWTQLSGSNPVSIGSLHSLNTIATGLTPSGVYTFRLFALDSNNNTSSDDIIVVVASGAPAQYLLFRRKTYIQ